MSRPVPTDHMWSPWLALGPSLWPWGFWDLLGWSLLSGNPLSTDLIFVLLGANLLIRPPHGPLHSLDPLNPPPVHAPPQPAGGGLLSNVLGGGGASWWGWDLCHATFPNPREDSGVWILTLPVPCSDITSSARRALLC